MKRCTPEVVEPGSLVYLKHELRCSYTRLPAFSSVYMAYVAHERAIVNPKLECLES